MSVLGARAARLLAASAVGGGVAGGLAVAGFALGAGVSGAGAAAVSALVTMAFFAAGQAVQVAVADRATTVVFVAGLASYVVRIGGVIALVLVAHDAAAWAGGAVLWTVVAVTAGWLAAEIWCYTRMRIPIYDEGDHG